MGGNALGVPRLLLCQRRVANTGPMLYLYNMAPRPSSAPLHNRISSLRQARGLSRVELADALGVNYQTVGYLEREEYAPSLQLAMRIAAYFDLPVESVFSRTTSDDRRTIENHRGERQRFR